MSTFCTFETEYRLTRIDQSLRRLSLSFTRRNSRIPRDLFGCHLSVSQWTHAVTGKPHPANLRPYSSSKRSDDLSTKHEVAFCQLGEVRQLSSVSIGRSRRVSSIYAPVRGEQGGGGIIAGGRARMDYDAYDIAEIHDRARALLPATARLWQELLADYIDPGATPLILDLGCGTGRFSELLAQRFGGQVIGIDPSERMVQQARRKPNPGHISSRKRSAR